jgi:hypothetical protein
MISEHASARTKQRYKDNNSTHLKIALRRAFANKNVIVLPNPVKNRVTVYFSSDKHFLWKVIMSKSDGTIVTVLPVREGDVYYAISKGLLDRSKMFKQHKYVHTK